MFHHTSDHNHPDEDKRDDLTLCYDTLSIFSRSHINMSRFFGGEITVLNDIYRDLYDYADGSDKIENIKFLHDMSELKDTAWDPVKAEQIMEEYINNGAPLQLNISAATREDILRQIAEADSYAVFAGAAHDICELAKYSVIPEFLATPQYKHHATSIKNIIFAENLREHWNEFKKNYREIIPRHIFQSRSLSHRFNPETEPVTQELYRQKDILRDSFKKLEDMSIGDLYTEAVTGKLPEEMHSHFDKFLPALIDMKFMIASNMESEEVASHRENFINIIIQIDCLKKDIDNLSKDYDPSYESRSVRLRR